jgi:phage terminase large subunit-like protein
VLEGWQEKEMVRPLYGTIASDGRRQYREALFGIGRKNGKSGVAAGLALWHLTYGGEAGGEVYSLAASRDQAKIVYDVARAMVEASPLLAKRVRSYRSVLEDPASGSIYRVLSRESRTAHGYNPNFVVVDELHCHPDAELYETMRTASGARSEPLLVSITTAGSDKASFCHQMYERGKAGVDKRLLFHWWEAPAGCDLDDEAARREANPASWVTPEFLDEQRNAAGLSENGYRRLHLNQWTDVLEAWLPFGLWDSREGDRGPIAPGEEVVLGFDGSFSNDSTALVACTFDGHLAVVGAWERPSGPTGDGWRVDIAEVEEAVRAACRKFSVVEVVCDPYRWQRSMQAWEAEGLPVLEWPTSSPARMVPATQKFTEAATDGRLSHDGDPRLARHIGNCVLKTDRLGPRVVKDHKMSPRKIDLAVAAIIAYDRATQTRELVDMAASVW